MEMNKHVIYLIVPEAVLENICEYVLIARSLLQQSMDEAT